MLALFMYHEAFEVGRLGRGSAIAVVSLLLVILLVLINAGLARLKTREPRSAKTPAPTRRGNPGEPEAR